MTSLKGVAVISAILACACGSGGALGQGRVAADVASERTELDAPLAAGASFKPRIELELRGGGTPALLLESARPNIVSVRGDRLDAVAPGLTAVLIKTRDSAVIDFFHVWVEAPTHVTLHRFSREAIDLGELTTPLDVVIGESVLVAPRIYAGPQRLTGSAETTWRIEPPLLHVLRDGVPERRRLFARGVGRAKLTLAALGKTSSLEVNVVPVERQSGVGE